MQGITKTLLLPFQEALQFYDTPRSVREALGSTKGIQPQCEDKLSVAQHNETNSAFSGPYANYDVPHPGAAPTPVFRKACGCVMKLVPHQNDIHCSSMAPNNSGNLDIIT